MRVYRMFAGVARTSVELSEKGNWREFFIK